VNGSDGEGKGVRVLSVCPTLACAMSITSPVGKQQGKSKSKSDDNWRLVVIVWQQITCKSSHLVSSRVRVRRVQEVMLCCVARYDIMHRANALCCVYGAEAQLGHVVVFVAVLFWRAVCDDGRAVRAFCGEAGLEYPTLYMMLNSTPRIPSSRLVSSSSSHTYQSTK
jgi:hypothetical protein